MLVELIVVIAVAVAAIAVAAAALIWALLLQRRLRLQSERIEQLEIQFNTLQEQSRLELLAMGQRVMAADRVVNRFAERIDALETTQSPGEHYGQLKGLSVPAEKSAPLSAAEAELAALLQKQQK